jgi:penicillin-binding protein 2
MQLASRIHQSRAQRQHRGAGARVIITLLVLALLVPLYRLQIAGAEQFALQASQNRMRPVVVRAPRGTIYDRHGRIVAENIVGYQILLMPAPLDTLHAQVERLRPVLGLTDADTASAFRRYRRAPHLPMEVQRDASPAAVAGLEERRFEFPEVVVQEYPKRHYPAGPAIAHFIGYVAEISENQLDDPAFAGYQQGRWVGKAGLEQQYEKWLGGEPGVRYLEIDARGRIQRWLPDDAFGQPAIPGRDLELHLDLDLQEFIASIFPKDRTGAIIALEPSTGGILAYYSNPSYDPNQFTGGITLGLWNRLREDPGLPLLDRVVGSSQPAASTWKLAVVGLALETGAIRPDEYMPIACGGGLTYGGRYWKCWETAGHGRMNLIEGIKNSCNVYFYQVGLRVGLGRFLEAGNRHHLGERTGIDVPHEIRPTFPSGPEYWERRFGYTPKESEILSMAIGQGPLEMTAIKLAQIYTALTAPGGSVPAPRLARNMGAPADTFHLRLSPQDVWYIEAGLRRVVAPGGTAQLSRLRDWEFIGKTGTAQNPHGEDHAWFVGMGAKPGNEPEIAVTMFLEFAKHGYLASGYVAEAINFYLDRKYGRPFQGWATPRHRGPRGLPVNWDMWAPIVDPPFPGAPPDSLPPADSAAPPARPDTAGTPTRPDTAAARRS